MEPPKSRIIMAFLADSSIITLSNQREISRKAGSLQIFSGIYISSKRQGHSSRHLRVLILYRNFLDRVDAPVCDLRRHVVAVVSSRLWSQRRIRNSALASWCRTNPARLCLWARDNQLQGSNIQLARLMAGGTSSQLYTGKLNTLVSRGRILTTAFPVRYRAWRYFNTITGWSWPLSKLGMA